MPTDLPAPERRGLPERPFTPSTLAERWGCTPNTIRSMIKERRLPAFKAGRRLYRIPAAAVREFEECQRNTGSEGYTDDTSSHGERTEPGAVIVLTHSLERKPRRKPLTEF